VSRSSPLKRAGEKRSGRIEEERPGSGADRATRGRETVCTLLPLGLDLRLVLQRARCLARVGKLAGAREWGCFASGLASTVTAKSEWYDLVGAVVIDGATVLAVGDAGCSSKDNNMDASALRYGEMPAAKRGDERSLVHRSSGDFAGSHTLQMCLCSNSLRHFGYTCPTHADRHTHR
jgi:hypothetical protein